MNKRIMTTTADMTTAEIGSIKPSPENDEIYGVIRHDDPDFVALVESIQSLGIMDPIRVSRDGWILSGHRRYAAALYLGMDQVEVAVDRSERRSSTKEEWMIVLISYNKQRVKSSATKLAEVMVGVSESVAKSYREESRAERDRDQIEPIKLSGRKDRSGISPRKMEFLNASIEVINRLNKYWPISDRHINYQLLNNNPPMRNTSQGSQRAQFASDDASYRDLCNILTRARIAGIIPWEAIADVTTPVSGLDYHRDVGDFAKQDMEFLFEYYRKDLLQTQRDHIELVGEKNTIVGIIKPIADRFTMPYTTGRGFCSIQPRHEIHKRYIASGKDRLILLMLSDFDPDGDSICQSFVDSMHVDFGIENIVAIKVLLREDQVKEWKLPPSQIPAKKGSPNYAKFIERYKSDKIYELEAIEPEVMERAVTKAIERTIDVDLFNAEIRREKEDIAILSVAKAAVAKAGMRAIKKVVSAHEQKPD